MNTRREVTKTLSKFFRDQYMETFEIGRGKPVVRKKSTYQLEIEEAFQSSDSDKKLQDSQELEVEIMEEDGDVGRLKTEGNLKQNLKDVLSFKSKHNVDNNLRKTKRKQMKKKNHMKIVNNEDSTGENNSNYYQETNSINLLEHQDTNTAVFDYSPRTQNFATFVHSRSNSKGVRLISGKHRRNGSKDSKNNAQQEQERLRIKQQQERQQMREEEFQKYFNSKKWMRNQSQASLERKDKIFVKEDTIGKKRKKNSTQINFKDYLRGLIDNDQVVEKLQNKNNLQKLVVVMDTQQIPKRYSYVTDFRKLHHSSSLNQRVNLLQKQDLKQYFIKKKFVPMNQNKGLFLQITKADIKHYLDEKAPAHSNCVIDRLDEREFTDIVNKFFFQSKSSFMQEQESIKTPMNFATRAQQQAEQKTLQNQTVEGVSQSLAELKTTTCTQQVSLRDALRKGNQSLSGLRNHQDQLPIIKSQSQNELTIGEGESNFETVTQNGRIFKMMTLNTTKNSSYCQASKTFHSNFNPKKMSISTEGKQPTQQKFVLNNNPIHLNPFKNTISYTPPQFQLYKTLKKQKLSTMKNVNHLSQFIRGKSLAKTQYAWNIQKNEPQIRQRNKNFNQFEALTNLA